jgi:hypothetical protein
LSGKFKAYASIRTVSIDCGIFPAYKPYMLYLFLTCLIIFIKICSLNNIMRQLWRSYLPNSRYGRQKIATIQRSLCPQGMVAHACNSALGRPSSRPASLGYLARPCLKKFVYVLILRPFDIPDFITEGY